MSIIAAVVTQVPIGNTSVEGLMTEDGQYAIAFSQLQVIDLVPPNRSLKQLEALLGISFQSHRKVKTALNPKPVNAIDLIDFEKLLRVLDRKGNKHAQLIVDSLVGLSLHQLFCDAFGIKFEKEERQQYLAQRMQHRQHFHPYLTRWLKEDAGGDNSAVEWAKEVNQFKKACKLPLTGVDTWDYQKNGSKAPSF